MNVAAIASNLRSMVGIISAGDGGQQIEDEILLTLNATLMEIYTQAPDGWLSRVPRAEVIKAPLTTSITVTQDAKNITFAGYQAWMLGCTIIIDGDSAQNQITIDAAAPPSLVKPYNGASGTYGAIVYSDAITLLPDVIELGSPVMLDQQWELVPASSMRDLQALQPGNYRGYVNGFPQYSRNGSSNFPLRTTDKRVTRPESFTTNRKFAFNAPQTLQVALSSLPDVRYTLHYEAQVFPFASTLTDARPEYLPFKYDEAILLPWLRYNFSAHPNVSITQAQLKPRFDQAVVTLKDLRPQQFQPQSINITDGW